MQTVKWRPYSREVYSYNWQQAIDKASVAKTITEKSWWTRIVEELKLDFEGLW